MSGLLRIWFRAAINIFLGLLSLSWQSQYFRMCHQTLTRTNNLHDSEKRAERTMYQVEDTDGHKSEYVEEVRA